MIGNELRSAFDEFISLLNQTWTTKVRNAFLILCFFISLLLSWQDVVLLPADEIVFSGEGDDRIGSSDRSDNPNRPVRVVIGRRSITAHDEISSIIFLNS